MHSARNLAFAACVLGAVSPCLIYAQSPDIQMPSSVPAERKLTLSQAQDEAFKHSPLIHASKEQVLSARANLAGQRVPVNPEFFYSGLNNTVSPFGLKDPSSYNVIFTAETNGAIQWRTSQARNQLFAIQADAGTTRISVRQAVTDAYINLQVANAALANEQEAYATSQKLSDLSEEQFSLGAAPETNAIRARIALTQEESNLLSAISNVRIARSNLDIQMGRNADEPVDVAEPLAYTPAHFQLEDLKKAAEANRPELRSAEFNTRALKAAVGLEQTQYLPQVFIGTDFRLVRKGVFQFGLSMPLFDFGSIRGAVNKARHDAKAQEAQTNQVRQSVGLDVETGYDNLTRAQRTVEAFQDGILPRSASLLDRIQKGYQLGGSTILDLIDAQNTYRTAHNDYASALGDHRHAIAQLERAIGGRLPTNSASSPATTGELYPPTTGVQPLAVWLSPSTWTVILSGEASCTSFAAEGPRFQGFAVGSEVLRLQPDVVGPTLRMTDAKSHGDPTLNAERPTPNPPSERTRASRTTSKRRPTPNALAGTVQRDVKLS